MLMPTIIVQAIDKVILNLYEIILGYGSLCYLYPESTAVFIFFLIQMGAKIVCSISVLNIYSDHHNHLATLVSFNEESHSLGPDSVEEIELGNQNLDFS
nr:IP18724p [Drosophila melanogaster]